jgi:hypothetical protein
MDGEVTPSRRSTLWIVGPAADAAAENIRKQNECPQEQGPWRERQGFTSPTLNEA